MVLFLSCLSCARLVFRDFTEGFKETIICDGYSAYGNLESNKFANCCAHMCR